MIAEQASAWWRSFTLLVRYVKIKDVYIVFTFETLLIYISYGDLIVVICSLYDDSCLACSYKECICSYFLCGLRERISAQDMGEVVFRSIISFPYITGRIYCKNEKLQYNMFAIYIYVLSSLYIIACHLYLKHNT